MNKERSLILVLGTIVGSYDSWDAIDDMHLQFYDVEFDPRFPALFALTTEKRLDCDINYNSGVITVNDDEKIVGCFDFYVSDHLNAREIDQEVVKDETQTAGDYDEEIDTDSAAT